MKELSYRVITSAERDIFYYCVSANGKNKIYFTGKKNLFKSYDQFVNQAIYFALKRKIIDYTYSTSNCDYDSAALYFEVSENVSVKF